MPAGDRILAGVMAARGFRGTDAARAWYAVALLTVCFILSYIDRQILSLLVIPIQGTTGMNDSQMGLLQGVSFSLFYVAASVPLARLADRGNRPRIIGCCVGIWSFMTMLCGLASNFWQLMSARIGVAVGEAALPPAALTFIADQVDRKGLARATSLFMLAPFIGGGLALFLGSMIYEASANWTLPVLPGLGRLERWQLLMILAGLPGLLIGPLVLLTLRESGPRIVAGEGRSFSDLAEYLGSEWRFQLPYMLTLSLMVMLLNAHIAWMPTAIIRLHEVDAGTMGMWFGPVYLIAGSAGTLTAGWIISRAAGGDMLRRTLQMMRIGTLLLVAPAIAAPFTPDLALTFVAVALAVFFTSAVLSMSSIPFQLGAPRSLRAQMIATSTLVAALLGTGLGPLLVGVMSDLLAGAAQPLSLALSLLAALIVPAGTLLMGRALRHAPELQPTES